MSTAAAPAGFSMGRVINRLFTVLGRNLLQLLLLSALLVGLPTALVTLVQLGLVSTSPGEVFSPARIGLGLGAVLISVVCNAVLQGAVIHATVNDLAGRKASFGENLTVGLRFFLPLVGISLIVAVGCGLGLILFIVPGVLLALVWSVAAPVEVTERVGVFGALSRSLELTRGNRGAILGLVVAYVIVLWIIEAALSAIALAVGLGMGAFNFTPGRLPAGLQAMTWVQAGLGLVTSTLLASLSSAGIASIYFELRQAKEGVGADQLAAVFD